METSFNMAEYIKQELSFPNISYAEFETIQDLEIRKRILAKNKIMQTDAYNRTMTFLRGEKGKKTEVHTLTFRKNANGAAYNIVYGIRNIIKSILGIPVNQSELNFARDFYRAQKDVGGNAYFDEAMWQDVIDTHGGYLPLEIKATRDGTVMNA